MKKKTKTITKKKINPKSLKNLSPRKPVENSPRKKPSGEYDHTPKIRFKVPKFKFSHIVLGLWVKKTPTYLLEKLWHLKLFHKNHVDEESLNVIFNGLERKKIFDYTRYGLSPISNQIKSYQGIVKDLNSILISCPFCRNSYQINRKEYQKGIKKHLMCKECFSEKKQKKLTAEENQRLLTQQYKVFHLLKKEAFEIVKLKYEIQKNTETNYD